MKTPESNFSSSNPARSLSRRNFLRSAGAAALGAPMILPASVFGQGKRPGANGRVTVGVIGLGAKGYDNMLSFLTLPDVQVVAVCDVQELHWRDKEARGGRAYGREPGRLAVEDHYAEKKRSGQHKGCSVYSDYRELCARDDIDAVCVSTPDHWHALATLEALRAGKDVYCEKPVTHTFSEGQAVHREAMKRKTIFQVGSQQRSEENFRHAVEIVTNGHLGKIRRVEVGLPTGYEEPLADATVKDPPANLDYDFWTGPAPMLPYMKARHHRLWRGARAYGGGNLMDWIGHHNDIAHWALGMDRSGPLSVEAVGWTDSETEIYDTPVQYEVRCEYPGGIEVSIGTPNEGGTKWIGENGWFWVNRGKREASNQEWLAENFDRGPKKAYASPGHHRNFIDGVKSRDACICPAETGHRSITPGHLGFVSQTLGGRKLQWDAANEKITGDEEAQKLLMATPYRAPWQAPA